MTNSAQATCENKPTSPLVFDWNVQFERAPNVLGLEYWKSRCLGRRMPCREDLDPVAMRKFTPHVGLIEIHQQDTEIDYFVRRAGSRIEDVFGPITGRYIREFLPPNIEDRWRTVYGAVRTEKSPVRVTTKINFQNKNWLSTEFLVAPLGVDDEPSMLFLTFVVWGEPIPILPPRAAMLHRI